MIASRFKETSRPLILDGAFGTELQRRGVDTKLPLWSAEALVSNQAAVRSIHLDYIQAGADIITTNTFRTNARTVDKICGAGKARELTLAACRLAHEAREQSGKKGVMIAGSLAPLEDCYRPELVPAQDQLISEHRHWAAALAEGGADFLFVETINTIREGQAALQAAGETGLPAAISFVCNREGNLLSGETLEEALEGVWDYRPLFVGTNCAPLGVIEASVRTLLSVAKVPVGVYANGDGKAGGELGWEFGKKCPVSTYVACAADWIKSGAKIIGGCCGTSPEYIAALRKLV